MKTAQTRAALLATLIVVFSAQMAYDVSAPAATDHRWVYVADKTFINEQVNVRQRFGLESDALYINGLTSDGSLDTSYLGIPLTVGETAEMDRRNLAGLALKAIDVRETIEAPDTYGGSWIDQSAGGVAVFQTTAVAMLSQDELQQMLPPDTEVRITEVSAPISELTALQTRVDNDWTEWQARGVDIVSDGIFPEDDSVHIVLQAGSGSDSIAALYEAYGDHLLVEVAPSEFGPNASRTATTGPLYGGMEVGITAANGSKSGCTVTLSSQAANGRYYGFTAGHCGLGGSYTQGGFIGDAVGTGSTTYNGFFNASSTNCDCARFGPIGSKHSHAVIANGGSLFTFTQWASSSSNYYVGRPACISGYGTNADICDQLHSVTVTTHISEDGHTTTINGQIMLYCPSRPGDSGAPIGNGPTWLGIHSSGYAQSGSNSCGSSSLGEAINSQVTYLPSYTNIFPDLNAV